MRVNGLIALLPNLCRCRCFVQNQMNKQINRIGFWMATAAGSATIAYDVIQLLQVYRVLHFPWDEILIYGSSLCIVLPFLLAMLALHYTTPPDKKFWSHAALLLSTIYAVFVSSNYIVQLATVIPARINGSAADIVLLKQTPHSLFWDYDAIGYIAMGIAMLLAVPALYKTGPQRWTRYAFIANALVTPLISIVYFYPRYSEGLLMLGFPWGITAPLAMIMLAVGFRRQRRQLLNIGVTKTTKPVLPDCAVSGGIHEFQK